MSIAGFVRSSWQLWLIILMVASVFIGGFFLMPSNDREKSRLLDILGTSNKGTLLIPMIPVAGLSATQNDQPWVWDQLKPKWRLVLPVANGCNQACRNMLYVSRQVHIRLDKNVGRLERLLLNIGDPLDEETLAFIQREHIYLKLVSADSKDFADLLEPGNVNWRVGISRLFVLDQQGNFMMFYTPEHDGGDILSDLRHLLKYSPEL